MARYLPPVGFHFSVQVLGVNPSGQDTRFMDVSGLNIELATEEVAEGGQNRFVQKYPVRGRHPELVLKRGLLKDSEIIRWVQDCTENLRITPRNIVVHLLNEEHAPLMTWHVVNAYPTRWTLSDFSASNNAIVVETLAFFYQYFSVDRG